MTQTKPSTEVWITGIGLATSLGEGLDAHWDALNQRRINVDEKGFAPCIVHPLAHINLDAQIPKKGDQRQMEAWQRIGTYAAGLALESAGVKGNNEILARMAEYRPLVEIPHARSETARRYRFEDGVGEIGIIAPVSHPFCGHCSRIRITSDGKLRTCLFSVWDHDIHQLMQRGATDEKLAEFILKVVEKKEERHHIGEPGFVPASRTMVHIGG